MVCRGAGTTLNLEETIVTHSCAVTQERAENTPLLSGLQKLGARKDVVCDRICDLLWLGLTMPLSVCEVRELQELQEECRVLEALL